MATDDPRFLTTLGHLYSSRLNIRWATDTAREEANAFLVGSATGSDLASEVSRHAKVNI